MSFKETMLQTFLVWCGVYPLVLTLLYAADWLVPGAPKWAVTAVSTAFTVTLFEFVLIPQVEKVIARRRGDTRAELLAAKARDAEGPADHRSANG